MKSKLPAANWLLFSVLLLGLPATARSQNGLAITGQVLDDSTKKPLENVQVEIPRLRRGDVTDDSGNFKIAHLGAGVYTIKVSRLGYKPKTVADISVNEKLTAPITIYLEETRIELPGVKVEAERVWEKHLTEASVIGVKSMKAAELKNIPGMLDDPVRAVQVFNGVAGVGDYVSYLAVRGSSPNQNQIYVDGVRIPNPYRFRLAVGGGLSSINPHTVDNLYLHLGGYSAAYGDALSSILEIETRRGSSERFHAQGNLNFTDATAVFEGPLPANVGSYIISARRTYYDLLINQFSKNNASFPYFYEISGRWSLNLGRSDQLDLKLAYLREGTELLGELSDDLNVTEKATSYLGSLSWRKWLSDRWRFHTILAFYRDATDYAATSADSVYDHFFDKDSGKLVLVGEPQRTYESMASKEINFSLKEDFRLKTGDASWVNLGVEYTRIPAKIDFNSRNKGFVYSRVESPSSIDFDRTYNYYAAYLESATAASEKIHLQLGLRYDYLSLIEEGEFSPRIKVWYKLNDRTTLEGAWGQFNQYPNPATVYSRDIPVDLSKNLDLVSAERATHQVLGIERALSRDHRVKLQVYNKDLERLLLPVGNSYAPKNNGTGSSRGFELFLEKKMLPDGRFSALMGYAYGNAKFRNIEDKERVWTRFKFDRRHAVTALAHYRLFGNWMLSAFGQYASGMPYTGVTGLRNSIEDGEYNLEFESTDRLALQLPAFKKLDLRLSYAFARRGRQFEFYLDVINITGAKNIIEITWHSELTETGEEKFVRQEIYMLPRIASIGIGFRL